MLECTLWQRQLGALPEETVGALVAQVRRGQAQGLLLCNFVLACILVQVLLVCLQMLTSKDCRAVQPDRLPSSSRLKALSCLSCFPACVCVCVCTAADFRGCQGLHRAVC